MKIHETEEDGDVLAFLTGQVSGGHQGSSVRVEVLTFLGLFQSESCSWSCDPRPLHLQVETLTLLT